MNLDEFDGPIELGGVIVEEKSEIRRGFLDEYLTGFGRAKGCALLGESPFDKLKAVQDFFQGRAVDLKWLIARKRQVMILIPENSLWDKMTHLLRYFKEESMAFYSASIKYKSGSGNYHIYSRDN
jgi:hypothetical protein